MTKEKIDFESVIGKGESISDDIISKVYNKGLVEKIEKLDFMKTLVKSSFIKSLQEFGKGWFKQVFVFFGYISIIFGVISGIMGIVNLFSLLDNILFLLSNIISILLSAVSIIVGLGMIKFKKWYPFAFLIQGGLYLVSIIFGYIVINSYYSKLMYGSSYSGLFVKIGLFLAIYTIVFALILKNKKLFLIGKGIGKKEVTKKSKEKKKEL